MHCIHNGKMALSFLMGGMSTITLKSLKTGKHFTYKVRAPREDGKLQVSKPIRFVQLLTGPDNNTSYEYIGFIRDGKFTYGSGKTRILFSAPSVKAFQWAYRFVSMERIPEGLEVYHEGKCGLCGRKLSTPESSTAGFGPECIKRIYHGKKEYQG